MIFFFVVVLIGAYAMAASWAVCRGPRRLWSTASGALLLIVAGVVLLGWHYAVPSRSRLVLYDEDNVGEGTSDSSTGRMPWVSVWLPHSCVLAEGLVMSSPQALRAGHLTA